MQKHTANYLKATGHSGYEFIACEICGFRAQDIHHLTNRSQGGSDEYENLIALCRDCHDKAHKSREVNERFKEYGHKRNDRTIKG